MYHLHKRCTPRSVPFPVQYGAPISLWSHTQCLHTFPITPLHVYTHYSRHCMDSARLVSINRLTLTSSLLLSSQSHTLKRIGRHVDEFVVTGYTGCCHFDNFRSRQLATFPFQCRQCNPKEVNSGSWYHLSSKHFIFMRISLWNFQKKHKQKLHSNTNTILISSTYNKTPCLSEPFIWVVLSPVPVCRRKLLCFPKKSSHQIMQWAQICL